MMSISQRIVGFSPKSQTSYSGESQNTLTSLSAWSAFRSGMQILQRYANRSPVNVHSIAKSNMQLLHRALSYDTGYSRSIDSIRNEDANSDLPTIRRLYSDQGLTADALVFRGGSSMNLIALPQRYSMYLVISGTAQLTSKNKQPHLQQHSQQYWWKRIGSSGNNNYLRSGSVVICSDVRQNSLLTAQGKNCVVLSVHIPIQETLNKIAS